jgi:UDP-2-acetamido-3-amino-2,3-dideoxy-glucuronate N-acetyltransferase
MEKDNYAHPTACVDEPVSIGARTRIWNFSHVMKGARLGPNCNVGQNVYVGAGVVIGRGVKIQNNVSIYEGVELDDYVFCGPSCVFTNVVNPRSEIDRKTEFRPTRVRRGASIGANATIVCGTVIGRYAFIAAGAVVPQGEVPDYALMVGVPARRRGWMSRHGFKLEKPDANGVLVCPGSGWRYQEVGPNRLRCLDHDEDAPLDDHVATR